MKAVINPECHGDRRSYLIIFVPSDLGDITGAGPVKSSLNDLPNANQPREIPTMPTLVMVGSLSARERFNGTMQRNVMTFVRQNRFDSYPVSVATRPKTLACALVP
jgi:hypothetical protein